MILALYIDMAPCRTSDFIKMCIKCIWCLRDKFVSFLPKNEKVRFSYYKNALDKKRINKTRNIQTLQKINKHLVSI